MSTSAPTGDFNCLICGAPGGHGNLPCPRMSPGTPTPYSSPYYGYFTPNYDAKLDRIIELLEAIARAHGHGWQGGPR